MQCYVYMYIILFLLVVVDLNRGRMNCNTFNSIYAVTAAFTHTHIAYPMQFMLAKITFHLHSAATINIHRKSSLLYSFYDVTLHDF